ncbi:MAG TPA: sugar transferase [Terriglobia bacterium]|nr:sugar transferase [Terriglobia bacterium]
MVRILNVYYPTRTIVLAFGEVLIIYLCFLLAVAYFKLDATLFLTYEHGFYKIDIVCAVLMVCLYYHDLYDSLVVSNPREVVTRLIGTLGAACVIMGGVYYAFPAVRLDMSLLGFGILLSGVLLGAWRKAFLVLNSSDRWAERAVILGSGSLAACVSSEIEKRPAWAFRLVGYVAEPSARSVELNGLPWLGKVNVLPGLVKEQGIRRVILGMNERRGQMPVEMLLQLQAGGTIIQDGSEVYEALTGKVALDSLRLSWLLLSPRFQVSQLTLAYKRVSSIVLATTGLILTLPVMILTAVAIVLDSGRPVLFRQERVGQNGKKFKLNKFRTMRVGADKDGQFKPAEANDPRITRVGKWLRRTRLDELPQLFNIIVGDMYFVGPRPFVPNQEEECAANIPFYSQRWNVKPGATGWAQVKRGYCATLEDNADKLAYDLFYIKNMSTGLDLLIAFETLKTLLLGRGGR